MILYERTDNCTHKIFKILGFKIKIKKKNVNYKANINGDNDILLNKNFHGRLIVSGNNNKIFSECCVRNAYIKISGDDNIIEFPNDCGSLIENINICINGSNNHITIESSNCYIRCLNITMGHFKNNKYIDNPYLIERITNNTNVNIGSDTTINEAQLLLSESDTSIIIKDNCMLSSGIEVFATDCHAITDFDDRLLNKVQKVLIGSHCWIGKNVFICKNTKIPSNSIVGACSVVTKRFEEENVIIAGNPAKIVKRNINWDRLSPDEYSENGMAVERVIPLFANNNLRKVA